MVAITAIPVLTVFLLFVDTCNGYCSASTSATSPSTTTVNYVQSPNYPSSYPNNQNCQWTLSVTSPQTIYYYIEFVSLESGYDYLKVYDDLTRVYHSGTWSSSLAGQTSSQTLEVYFSSDYSIQYGGFSLGYLAIDSGSAANCGSTLTATSTQQQLVYEYAQQGSSCTITITASSSNNVQFTVLLVSGYVTWTDVSTGSTYYQYQSGSATYLSTGSSLQFTGGYGNNWVVLYEEVGSTVTAIPFVSSTNSDTDVCNSPALLTADSTAQYLTSPNYPNPYTSNLYCQVVITAWSEDDSVFLEILDIDLETSDNLYIYSGVSYDYPRDTTSLDSGMNITSLGSSFSLEFLTDRYSNLRGFYIRYTNVSRTIPTCAQSYTMYNVNSLSQTLTSPNYPSNYDNYVDEYWLLVKPNETDTIFLELTFLKLENHLDCGFDYINIYDGPCTGYGLLAHICGENKETIIDSSGQYILMHFHTDGSVTYKGFSMNVYTYTGYVVPGSGESTDGGSGLPIYVYPIITIAVVLFIICVICIVVYSNKRKRVARVGSSAHLIAPPMKKLTTNQLLVELQRRYGSAEQDKTMKPKRKQQVTSHPKPNPPGPGVQILNMNDHSHPPPGTQNDPAYPPAFMGFGTQMPQQAPVAPSFVPGQGPPPVIAGFDAPTGVIPPPYPYVTPAEARANGSYRQ